MKEKPNRHSDIYTLTVPDCLRIKRTDATIYVTAENARQFLDNLDKGEPFELSDGTPTTVVDVPCLVSIELTAEEAARLKRSVEDEFRPSATHKNAYSLFRFSGREQSKSHRTRQLVATRDEYVRRQGLTLTDLPSVKGRSVDPLAAFLNLTLAGKIPPGSVLIVESFNRIASNDIRSLLATLFRIMNAGVTIVGLNPEQEFSADNIITLVMALVSAGKARPKGHSR